MSLRSFLYSTPVFLTVFLLQEAVVTQLRLPLGGFNLLLIVALIWAALSTPEIGALTGFGAGIAMDLSQSSSGPMGQWTLVMIIACYVVAFLGYGDDNIHANAIGIVFFVVIANFCVEIAYLITGALLGVSIGSLGQIVITLFGMSIWALMVSPIMLPVFTRLHALIFDSRSSL